MLLRKEITDNCIWGIWKIEEETEDLLSQINKDDPHLTKSSSKRLKEQVAVRVLLKNLLDEEKPIEYTSTGRPYLTDQSYNISISHTKGYAAVILSKTEVSGIDIEYISEKVIRVQEKYISNKEYIDPEQKLIHLLLHWSAKETMYKALGYSEVDLKEHLRISHFTPIEEGCFASQEFYSSEQKKLTMYYSVTDDYVLTFTY